MFQLQRIIIIRQDFLQKCGHSSWGVPLFLIPLRVRCCGFGPAAIWVNSCWFSRLSILRPPGEQPSGSVTASAVALPNWLHRLSACSSSLHSIFSGVKIHHYDLHSLPFATHWPRYRTRLLSRTLPPVAVSLQEPKAHWVRQNGDLLFNARNSSRSAIHAQGNPVRIRVLPEYVQF